MNVERNPTEARQAEKTGVVRNVLAISLAAAAIAMAAVFIYFYR
jgi:hypothetical protein